MGHGVPEDLKLLLPSCKDIEGFDMERHNGRTENALFVALKYSIETLQFILDHADWLGINVNGLKMVPEDFVDDEYFYMKAMSILMKACWEPNPEAVEFMLQNALQYRLDFTTSDEYCKISPFAIACYKGSMEIVNILLNHSDKVNLNSVDGERESGFFYACREGHYKIVKRIIEVSDIKSINLNARDYRLENGFFAASVFGQMEVLDLLIQHSDKIDINCKNAYGDTALIEVCRERQFDAAKKIIDISEELKIDLNFQDNTSGGETAFLAACSGNHEKIVEYMIQQSEIKNIDLNRRDKRGSHAIHLAINGFGSYLRLVPDVPDTAKLLIKNARKKNIDIFSVDDKGQNVYDFFIKNLNHRTKYYPESIENASTINGVKLWLKCLVENGYDF